MWHDIQQNTDEWLDLRKGKVTGSVPSIGSVMAHSPGKFGDPAKRLAINIAVERITGKRIESDNYTDKHTERGHEEEPIARMLYEERYFTEVTNGGFYDNGETGSSPDGRVGEDGLIEIKSVIPTTHHKAIKGGSYDSTYKWQYFFNLRESKREWIDFVSYCSAYPEKTRLYVFRINKADIEKELSQIEARLVQFEQLIESAKEFI